MTAPAVAQLHGPPEGFWLALGHDRRRARLFRQAQHLHLQLAAMVGHHDALQRSILGERGLA